jgi:hypothetical protein
MGGHPQANGLALWVANPTWHFFGGLQDEGERARRSLLDGPELAVVDSGVVGQLAQVTAQHGQVVFVVDPADTSQLVRGIFVVQVANQSVAGVGRHRQNAALVEQLHRLLEQTGLRVFWVDNEKLGHLEICWMK